MNVKRLIISVFIVATILFGTQSIVKAECVQIGKIMAVSAGATSFSVWITVNSPSYPTYYYQYVTTNATLRETLLSAYSAGKKVRIQGSATSCPTAGTVRNGGSVISVVSYTYY